LKDREKMMIMATRYATEKAAEKSGRPDKYLLDSLHEKIQAAKFAIDNELGRATNMKFRLKLVLTANSLRNLEEEILLSSSPVQAPKLR
jgi:hypothetical protein